MIIDPLIKIAIIVLLGICLWLGHNICIAVMSNIDKLGSDKEAKERISAKVIANFWIGFAAVVIITAGIFRLISRDLFIALLLVDLGGLGLKLTTEILNKTSK